jgi:REP element-mobilizing transposase RayT
MSNHVHVVFGLLGNWTIGGRINSLKNLLQSIKSYSGRKANEKLTLTGKFWEEESYDRLVRNDAELIRIIQYVLNNPVKAGLCQSWREWPYIYVKPEYDMF